MKTIIRLLMIAAIVSFVRGPLNNIRLNHPVAWKDGVSTLKNIPKMVGQILTREASLLNQTGALSNLNHQTNGPSVTPPSHNASNVGPNGPSSSSLFPFMAGSTSSQSHSGNTNVHPSQPPASNSTNGPSDSQSPSLSALLTNPMLGLSQWVMALPGGNPLKDVKVTGLTKTDAGNLISHASQLDLLTVLPKLDTLSKKFNDLTKKNPALSSTNKSAYVQLFNQTMALLKLNATFYLNSQNGQAGKAVSLLALLNQPHLNQDQVKVSLQDASTHKALAKFTLQAKPSAQSVLALPSQSGHPS